MTPATSMILLMAASAALRVVIGRRHPVPLVPLVLACGVWSGETRGSLWYWAFLTLGVVVFGVGVWLVVQVRVQPDRHRAPGRTA